MLHALIMAGGAGTRFWPASRQDRPKQLLNLIGERTMIQATADRLVGLVDTHRWLVMTNQTLVQPIRDQLPDFPDQAIIGEPAKRDTAPCIGLAAALIAAKDPQATMIVLPADHVIQPVAAFQSAVQHAVALVDQDPQQLVTFGISPTWPADSYGYIEATGSALADCNLPTWRVARFHEKPDRQTAAGYIDSGNFHWNSGIFVWKAQTVLNALKEYEPEMYRHIDTIAKAGQSEQFESILQQEFPVIEGKSIDFAVMERYPQVLMIQAPFEWDDLGNWSSVPRLAGTDPLGNSITGNHVTIDTTNSIIRSENQHLIVTLGVDNLIVVHTPDATLIADRTQESKIKEVVAQLEKEGRDAYL